MTRNGWNAEAIAIPEVEQVKDVIHPAPPEMRERKRQAAALKMAARVMSANDIKVPAEVNWKSADLLAANVVDLPHAIRDLGDNPSVRDLMKIVRTCGI